MTAADSSGPENQELLSQEAANDLAGNGPRKTRILKRRRPPRKAMAALGSIVIAILVLSAAWILSGTSRPEVTIVAIVPLSGVSSYLVEIEDAMIMTVENLNRWGGLNGLRIRLVVEDCGSNPEAAMIAMTEAVDRYQPLAVVTATRGAAVPMAELAEANGVVLICVGATSENITEDKDWIFRYYIGPSGEAETAFDILASLDVSSLGILHLDDVYGVPVMEELTDAFEATGGTAEAFGFYPTTTDFSDGVANVTDNEAVFVVALRHQYQTIFEELNSIGYAGHVLCGVEASIPDFWTLPEAEGAYVAAPLMYNPGAPLDTEFLDEFTERFGRQLTHQGAIGVDVMRLIWGLLSDKEVTRDNLRNVLNAGFVNSGLLGIVSADAGVHNANIPLFGAVIEGGELRYLS